MLSQSPLLNAVNRNGSVRKLSMWTESHLSPSLKSRWRNQRVSRNWRRPQRICTKRCKLDETEVCENSSTGLCSMINFLSTLFPDMAAGMERLLEYKTYNSQFCKRIFDYLSIMFTAQVRSLSMASMEGADITPVILSRRCSLAITMA